MYMHMHAMIGIYDTRGAGLRVTNRPEKAKCKRPNIKEEKDNSSLAAAKEAPQEPKTKTEPKAKAKSART
jgi:hypothetical protein